MRATIAASVTDFLSIACNGPASVAYAFGIVAGISTIPGSE
jgi:hypothetical protein